MAAPNADEEMVLVSTNDRPTRYHRRADCNYAAQLDGSEWVPLEDLGTTKPCSYCAVEDKTDGESIDVCPACDHPQIQRTTGGLHAGPIDSRYRCRQCGESFDEPKTRKRRRSKGSGCAGLAGKLMQADPEDVSADHVDDDQLVTDGGTIDWPAGFDRTPAAGREPNQRFEVSMSDAFDHLEAEIRRQEVDDFRYEFDAQSRKQDRRPYARANPEDPSFVVRWSKDGHQFAVACDAYSRLRDNVHAVGKYINEKGRMQRRPVTTGKSEFANAQLPSGDQEAIVAAELAHEVLGVDPDASDAEVQAAYQEAVKESHPDHGGSQETLREVRRAKEVLTGDT